MKTKFKLMRKAISVLSLILLFQISIVSANVGVLFQDVESDLVEKSFSGSIFISHGDKVLYSKSFGYSDRENGTKFDKHTVFDIGSITKQFLATSIMKLSEQGLLSVEDEISKYFKGVPEDKKKINPLCFTVNENVGLLPSRNT